MSNLEHEKSPSNPSGRAESETTLARLIFDGPVDPRKASKGIVRIAWIALAIMLGMVAILNWVVPEPLVVASLYLPHILGAIAIIIGARLGRTKHGVALAVAFGWVGLTIATFGHGGITHFAVIGFPLLVTIAGVIWKLRFAVGVAIAAAVSLITAALLETSGHLTVVLTNPHSPVRALMATLVVLGITLATVVAANQVVASAVGTAQRTQARFGALVHQSPDALVFMDKEARVQFMNDASVALCGYSRQEILGLRIDLLPFFPPQFRKIAAQTYHAILQSDLETPPREARIINKSGRELVVEVNRRRVELPDGALGIQYTIRDISERRRSEGLRYELQNRLQEAQRLETVGQLAGGVAHDFNNLLTVILGQGELLLYQDLPDHTRAQIQQILKAGDRARVLTQQLLAYARRQRLELTSVYPNAAIKELLPLLQTLAGQTNTVTVLLDEKAGTIRVDPGQLDQVLTNLVANGRDALPTGGTIIIRTKAVVGKSQKAGVQIVVEDNGHGMDEETQARIFEPFFTTKDPDRGTGLGLAVVDGIVSQNGGQISVKSAPGEGCQFILEFPCAETPAQPEGERAQTLPATSQTILLVEDEEAVRETTEAMLRALGYEVCAVSDAKLALQTVTEAGRRFGLILTDIVMPGQTGPQLVEKLRTFGVTCPVIFMSGYVRDAASRGIPAGSGFLRKPFSAQQIAEQINAVFSAKRDLTPVTGTPSRES